MVTPQQSDRGTVIILMIIIVIVRTVCSDIPTRSDVMVLLFLGSDCFGVFHQWFHDFLRLAGIVEDDHASQERNGKEKNRDGQIQKVANGAAFRNALIARRGTKFLGIEIVRLSGRAIESRNNDLSDSALSTGEHDVLPRSGHHSCLGFEFHALRE